MNTPVTLKSGIFPAFTIARPKVLIVDDQASNLVAAAQVLSPLPIEVMTAGSGLEALTLVLRHEFAVILLDVNMPGMDGYEAATLIRDHTAKNPVPIIFLTAGERAVEKMARGYESGAIDFLYKPIEPFLLRSKVNVFLELNQHRAQLVESGRAMREAHQRLNRLLEAVGEGVIGINAEGLITLVNRSACELLGTSNAILQNCDAAATLGLLPLGSAGSPWAHAIEKGIFRDEDGVLLRADAPSFPAEYSISTVDGGSNHKPSFVMVFKDISERKAAADRLRHQAENDFLTGLANRLAFERHLELLLTRTEREGDVGFALLYLDLDGFKPINDQYGHDVGDHVLKQVAHRLSRAVRADDVCARLGGDEFAVVLAKVDDLGQAERITEKILDSIREPIPLATEILKVGASVGIALYKTDGTSVEEIIRAADLSMYQIKRLRKQGLENFSNVRNGH
ncbi:MAG: diguanylate cyclase [Pseudomonadota bacterium]